MIKNTVIFLILLFLPSVLYGEVTVSMEELGERIPINSPIDGFDNNSNSYLDPFKNDPILFTITSENYKQFEQNVLTPGQITMFETYPNSFKMNIYKSRRSCSVPQEVIDLTVENAIMTNEGEGIEGVIGSIPFPNPSEALHHVWNHILRYRGVDIEGGSPYYIINPDGSRVMGAGKAIARNFWNPFLSSDKGLQGMIMSKVTEPPRLADAAVLVIESLNAFENPRRAWVYNPGTRRVRRAPDIAYDNYSGFSQGLTTTDSFDGFNGAKDRYDWSSLGEQLRFMPYNAYKFHEAKVEETLTPFHVNQDLLRYELVRVNVVRADLKKEKRHILPHRVMYFDYDSHNMLAEDVFDGQQNIIRYRELPQINYYDEPMCNSIHSATYDFATRRYILNNVRSSDVPKINWRLDTSHQDSLFTPEGLKRWAK
tara:strand:+ start:454 stop:1731 length:1278 start_codon:yes stop_codon:yes gene_type:complete